MNVDAVITTKYSNYSTEDLGDGNVLLLDAEKNKVHVLNDTAFFILKNCKDSTIRKVLTKMIDTYEFESEKNYDQIFSETEDCFSKLFSNGLIKYK